MRYVVVAIFLCVGSAIYVEMAKPTTTATYDQFGRLVSVEYGPMYSREGVVFPREYHERDSADGCLHLSVFLELKEMEAVPGRLKEVMVHGPDGPDLCDQMALEDLFKTLLPPEEWPSADETSTLPYIGWDIDGESVDL